MGLITRSKDAYRKNIIVGFRIGRHRRISRGTRTCPRPTKTRLEAGLPLAFRRAAVVVAGAPVRDRTDARAHRAPY